MNNYILFVVLMLLSAATMSGTCKNEEGEVTLATGETVVRRLDGERYSIAVANISDNRCPKDVKCVRAGEAIVQANITAPDGSATLKQFCTGLDCRMNNIDDTETLQTRKGSYELKLESVIPYPVQGNRNDIKKARFVISKI